MKRVKFGPWCVALAVCVLVAGCKGEARKGASQSLANVNGTDITVHQLNQELQQVPVPTNAQQQEALRKQLLESLIDRQVLLDAATAAKLDRNPAVMQQLERVKAQTLAQAYLQERTASVAQPTEVEIKEFYSKNPELFANRKLFEVRQLVIPTASFDTALQTAVDGATSLDDIAKWMDAHQVTYRSLVGNKSSADLPRQIVAELDVLGGGKPFIVKESEQINVLALKHVKDIPVTAAESAKDIGNFLAKKKLQDAAKAEVARLRAAAAVSYVDGKPAAQGAAGAPAAPDAATASAAKLDLQNANIKLQ